MKITLTSVLVDDQAKALAFYTEVLGFRKKTDVPLGEHRWLTVVSPEEPDGVRFTQPPAQMGPATTAVLHDTCGNLIQIAAVSPSA
jgi:predicted enzyme related to lactoylglutathione lyase